MKFCLEISQSDICCSTVITLLLLQFNLTWPIFLLTATVQTPV